MQAQFMVEHSTFDEARRSEVRCWLTRRLRMGARKNARTQFGDALSCRFVVADFRPNRTTRSCGMDAGRFARVRRRLGSAFSIADAQIHLGADTAGCVRAKSGL